MPSIKCDYNESQMEKSNNKKRRLCVCVCPLHKIMNTKNEFCRLLEIDNEVGNTPLYHSRPCIRRNKRIREGNTQVDFLSSEKITLHSTQC